MILSNPTVLKLKANGYKYPVTVWEEDSRLYFKFAYNVTLKDEIKAMQGARWDPDRKLWHVANSQRNEFQLQYLVGADPYGPYDAALDLTNIPVSRFNVRLNQTVPIYKHQREGTAHIIQRRQTIVAGEMGTGKSLMMGLALEQLAAAGRHDDAWYIGPRSAIAAVQRDFGLWRISPQPDEWLTYEAFTSKIKRWDSGLRPPRIVLFDEASKLKNPTSQRTQAAVAVTEAIRKEWGEQGIISLLSGTPAPKSPADWWSLAEVACPGFLKEGDINKFKRRLGIIVMKEGIDRGSYPQLLHWRDDAKRCDICGEYEESPNHTLEMEGMDQLVHRYKPSVNEVQQLYERLKGLTVVYFKKDCLTLPDKIYRVVEVSPSAATKRAASLIAKTARTTIEGLTRLRELSDGFQYSDVETGKVQCSLCSGNKVINGKVEVPDTCPNCKVMESVELVRESDFDITSQCYNHTPQSIDQILTCPNCGGEGVVPQYKRETQSVSSPKDQALIDLLDEYEDVGRVVIFAGFTGSLDRVQVICQKAGWNVVRLDQGKTSIIDPKGENIGGDFLNVFQDQLTTYEKVAFIANPESGGMGLTLTASPVIIYFSNTFSAEHRIQSEDRCHRPGMDLNRGLTIVDIVNLPSDLKVIENLKKKKNLLAMTLGDFRNEMVGERVL